MLIKVQLVFIFKINHLRDNKKVFTVQHCIP